MTREEVKAIPGIMRFLASVVTPDGTVMFCLPVPGMQTAFTTTDDGCTIPACTTVTELETCKTAWDNYIRDLTGTDMTVTNWLDTGWVMPTDDELHEILGDEYVTKAEYDALPKKKNYRTKAMAGATIAIPDVIASPSVPQFSTAITVLDNKETPHIVPIQQAIKIEYLNGKFVANGVDLADLDLATARDPALQGLDLSTLRVLYSAILQDLVVAFNAGILDRGSVLFHAVTLNVAELMKMLGMKANNDKAHVDALIDKIHSYQNMVGVDYVTRGGKTYENKTAMLVWIQSKEDKNTITFAAPYLNQLAYDIMQASIQTDSKGQIIRKKNGEPKLLPANSYLMKSSIASERNKQAVEVVKIVCDVIEQTGSRGGVPNISAKTILARHPMLQQALDHMEDPSNKNRLLKRTFCKAWELLHTQTYLESRYEGIRFPATWPTTGSLDMVFEFPHNGKKRRPGQD